MGGIEEALDRLGAWYYFKVERNYSMETAASMQELGLRFIGKMPGSSCLTRILTHKYSRKDQLARAQDRFRNHYEFFSEISDPDSEILNGYFELYEASKGSREEYLEP